MQVQRRPQVEVITSALQLGYRFLDCAEFCAHRRSLSNFDAQHIHTGTSVALISNQRHAIAPWRLGHCTHCDPTRPPPNEPFLTRCSDAMVAPIAPLPPQLPPTLR